MAFEDTLSSMNISATGASAERLRMEVVANNVANAFSTRTPRGGPFRRQDVVFAAIYDDKVRNAGFAGGSRGHVRGADQLGGVRVDGIVDDPSELVPVYNPGHPDADINGFVLYPNVQIPIEMVNLITANRAYEANIRVMQAFRQEAEEAINLLRV
ncbi:MAG TPA: flagellar basal body rod protein FlgC [Gemmataceae bacterium]|nr:flagellar basal body rod protein FlgC [Gemmataceae bacterium]